MLPWGSLLAALSACSQLSAQEEAAAALTPEKQAHRTRVQAGRLAGNQCDFRESVRLPRISAITENQCNLNYRESVQFQCGDLPGLEIRSLGQAQYVIERSRFRTQHFCVQCCVGGFVQRCDSREGDGLEHTRGLFGSVSVCICARRRLQRARAVSLSFSRPLWPFLRTERNNEEKAAAIF